MKAEPDPSATGADRDPAGRNRLLHPVEWAESSGASAEVLRALEHRLARRRHRRLAAAGALLLALVVWRLPDDRPVASPPAAGPPPTLVVNVPARSTLEDGTVAEARPGAEFDVAFTAAVRRVVLRSGAVHFAVAKNPARPFVVAVGGVELRAVGTAFAVQCDPGTVNVVVTEGTVALEPPNPPGGPVPGADAPAAPMLLDAGASASIPTPEAGRVRVSAALPEITRLSPTEIAARLAWRVPTIQFSGTELQAIVTEINRHSGVRLVLADPALAGIRLSGVLRADNLETLLRLLKDEHGVRASRESAHTLTLHRAP